MGTVSPPRPARSPYRYRAPSRQRTRQQVSCWPPPPRPGRRARRGRTMLVRAVENRRVLGIGRTDRRRIDRQGRVAELGKATVAQPGRARVVVDELAVPTGTSLSTRHVRAVERQVNDRKDLVATIGAHESSALIPVADCVPAAVPHLAVGHTVRRGLL